MRIHSTLDYWFWPKHLKLGLVSHSFKITPLLFLLQPLQQPICNTLVLHHLTSNALLEIIRRPLDRSCLAGKAVERIGGVILKCSYHPHIKRLKLPCEYKHLLRRLRQEVGEGLLDGGELVVAHPVHTNAFIATYTYNFPNDNINCENLAIDIVQLPHAG